MNDKILAYCLDQLSESERLEFENQLANDPQLVRKCANMKRALDPLAWDREDAPPPSDLVMKTVARMAEHLCSKDLPQAPRIPQATGPVEKPWWWKRSDYLVAASVLFLAVGMLLPFLLNLRNTSAIECKNNLRVLFQSLSTYYDVHKEFPNITKQAPPFNVAGMVVPVLVESGTLPNSEFARCPGKPDGTVCKITYKDLVAMNPEDFHHHSSDLSPFYAYSLGYKDLIGGMHFLDRSDLFPASSTPIMADSPVAFSNENSPNHDGKGQNILFLDGHVSFFRSRNVRDDDIFLNRENQVAAGLDRLDFVLGASSSRP